MINMTHRTNITIDVKIVDLDMSHLYSRNHMVGMDKISSNGNSTQNLVLGKWFVTITPHAFIL
jgi:hypothetical protein